MNIPGRPVCSHCDGTRIEPQSAPPAPCVACSAPRTTFRAQAAAIDSRQTTTAVVRDGAVRM